MKGSWLVLGAALLLTLAGCSGADDSTTKSAGSEVISASDKGGAQPNPSLPAPMAGGGQKTGKFRTGGPGG